MPTYTVHAPPPGRGGADPERFLFLRDGFHFWAFIAPPLWLLLHRQWLALLGYGLFMLALVGGLVWLGAGAGAVVAAALCVSLLIGFEANSIRRWTLARRGWSVLGFVVGEDEDVAERRFFARWAERRQTEPPEPGAPAWRAAPPRPEVIGLFPQPDRAR